jgi:hypothetical protein
MGYIVSINGIQINDEPIGLADASVEISRDQDMKMVFSKFISDLVFWGDGYSVLKSQIALLNNICEAIPISIVEDCANGFEFEGVLFPSDTEENLSKCTIKATIEDDELESRIVRLKDLSVTINGGKTLNGLPLANLTTTTLAGRQYWYLKDVIQYIVDYITDSSVSIDSSLINTNVFRQEVLIITISGATPTAGQTLVISYVDIYGKLQTINFTYTATLTLEQELRIALNQDVVSLDNLGGIDFTFPISTEFNSPTGLRLEFWNESNFSINSSGMPGVTFTITPQQTYSYGLANIMISPDSIYKAIAPSTPLTNTTGISLLDIFTPINSMANVAMRFYRSGSSSFLKIEPEEEFFNNTSLSLTIRNIKDLTRKPYEDWGISELEVASSANDIWNIFNSNGYVGQICGNSEYRASFERMKQAGSTQGDDYIYAINLFSTTPFDGTYTISWRASGAVSSALIGGCIQMSHYLVARQWAFRANALTYRGNEMKNPNALLLNNNLNFDHPLTIAEYNTLSSNIEGYLKVNAFSDVSLDIEAYVLNVQYKIKDGMTTFELISE